MAQQAGRAVTAQQSQPDFRLLSGKGLAKASFDLVENNILLQCRVNNSQPIWFIFDTGASVNVINEKLAKNLGLMSRGVVNPSGGGGTVSGTFSEGATISLPGVEAFKQRFFAIPLDALPTYFGRDVEGIIGADFIRNFVIEIDFADNTLTLHDPKTYNLSGERDTILLENRNGTPYVKVEFSLDGQDTITDQFELDSGSIRILQLNKPFADRHKVLTILPKAKAVEGVGGAGIGGKTKFVEARIRSLRLGRYTLPSPVISVSQDTEGFGAGNEAGAIGTELLRRFKVTLDYQSQRMKLSPNVHFDEPFEVDMSGLELTAKANELSVIQ
ncbi:MAG TPA: retropepsin-like aspartic protease, partial [Pyrinomonadaceae bacterium]